MPNPPNTQAHTPLPKGRPRLYGRAKGRPLRRAQKALMQTLYPEIEIPKNPMTAVTPEQDIWMEVGFGGGEHLVWQAHNNPGVHIWGAEPFINGVAKVLSDVDAQDIHNIRLYNGDGRDVIENMDDGTFKRIFVLFPDPWPKTKHQKRRIITPEFLQDLHRVLAPGGIFRFGSDIISYVDWTLERVKAHGGFSWAPTYVGDWRVRPGDWPQTRYEQKALREGRTCHYFEFVRV